MTLEIKSKNQTDLIIHFPTVKYLKDTTGVKNILSTVCGLVTKTDFNTNMREIREIQNKTPNIRGYVTHSALNTKANKTENKIPVTTLLLLSFTV